MNIIFFSFLEYIIRKKIYMYVYGIFSFMEFDFLKLNYYL